ncbi:MAG: hypothetical protein ABH879_05375 [archaeon]
MNGIQLKEMMEEHRQGKHIDANMDSKELLRILNNEGYLKINTNALLLMGSYGHFVDRMIMKKGALATLDALDKVYTLNKNPSFNEIMNAVELNGKYVGGKR